MQKIISVNVASKPNDGDKFLEIEFPIVQSYLDDGYYVKQVYQMAPSTSLYCFTITFILEKI